MWVELSPRPIECQSRDDRNHVDFEQAKTETALIRRAFRLTGQVDAIRFNRNGSTTARDELARNHDAPVEVTVRLERADLASARGDPNVRCRIDVLERRLTPKPYPHALVRRHAQHRAV